MKNKPKNLYIELALLIVRTKALKLNVLIGCMTETSCAIAAAAQPSPLCYYANLDGPLLIKHDLFEGLKHVDGKLVLSDNSGFEVIPKAYF